VRKAARGTVRRLGHGNGTAVPGKAALAIDRRTLEGLAGQIRRGVAATDIVVEPDPIRGFQLALARTPADQPLWVVSTYLVLWRLRDWLRRQGYVGAIWER
jgi:hypothetical protein